VLEAMACGLPVVATRVGGTPEVVIDGVTGLLVSPGDPMQMADAILRVYHQREIAGKMGRAGRARAEAHFDVREMVRSYESLYPDVLQDRQMRAA
jgi:glycosyltransferase involved in cell wall biosynthesis